MAVKMTSERWQRAGKAMRPDDRQYAEELARMAKCHSPAVFYGFDDPLEAAVFSVLVELLKRSDTESR
jgi:hypothetical protein